MKKMKKTVAIPLAIVLVMIILNIIARLSSDFADFHTEYIFPIIMTAGSFVSGLFPFSVGEVLIKIGILLVILGIPSFVLFMIFAKKSRRKIASSYAIAALWIFTYILTSETLNCFIMYQCTKFSDKYFDSTEHTEQELATLYAMLIDKSNELAAQVERDENGCFKFTADLNSTAKAAMKNISTDYELLDGFYPDAKAIQSDFFMSQNNLLGIYFPFSLEANYNPAIYDINLPNTICHEYAHLKGIIQEDEAGFIAFIASTNSGDIDFEYSGYINALEYVHNEVYEQNITSAYEYSDDISDLVINDWFSFVSDDYWVENEEKEIISTETVSVISDNASDVSLKMNGVEDGKRSYCRMVTLLLDYYFN